MSITLCMVVKNESENLRGCLQSILPFVDEVLIADTGSTDGSQELIHELARIEPIRVELDAANCFSLTPARNELYSRVRTDWIFYLDADERFLGAGGNALRVAIEAAEPNCAGFFGKWLTKIKNDCPFEDYKLFTFRRGSTKRGLAHANVQLDLRLKGQWADWLDSLIVNHHPPVPLPAKRELYWSRLQRSMVLEPGWFRHNWYAGYMCFQDGNYDEALDLFRPLVESCSLLFPVEGLNARMVALDIAASRGDHDTVERGVHEALAFYDRVIFDFEVKINFRIKPWLANTAQLLREGRISEIQAYKFVS